MLFIDLVDSLLCSATPLEDCLLTVFAGKGNFSIGSVDSCKQ